MKTEIKLLVMIVLAVALLAVSEPAMAAGGNEISNGDGYVNGGLYVGGVPASTPYARRLILTENTASSVGAQFQNNDTGSAGGDGFFFGINSAENALIWNFEQKDVWIGTSALPRMVITKDGDVGIGTTTPSRRLVVYKDTVGSVGAQFQNSETGTAGGDGFFFGINSAENALLWNFEQKEVWIGTSAVARMVIDKDGNVGIGNTTPSYLLDVNGEMAATVLNVKGADVSEQFKVASPKGLKTKPAPGMVVSIDPKNPGSLLLSAKAYDRKVAGIISGAGDIAPGMVMNRAENGSDAHPVALTGRVYCHADASKQSIAPGDLLTTSDTPGHAMKVTDYSKAQGAIIGKAMTSLAKGEKGMVLVLVTLQ